MKRSVLFIQILVLLMISGISSYASTRDFYDIAHYSKALGQVRHFRAILPRDYETSGKYYPVIYYFHGHSGRYLGETYPPDNQPFMKQLVDYVRHHDVIVIRWDGWMEDEYSGLYGGSPYDLMKSSGKADFGAYFLELVSYVDSTFRTIDDRQHRATSGLSMGGWMSLYLSGRFPDMIGSASAFNPAHEFHVGPEGKRILYLHKDHAANHGHQYVRLISASGDYISQYHNELKDVMARTPEINFAFRQDEFHRHWVTSVNEAFDWHMKAFDDFGLTSYPVSFDYDNAQSEFSVWGYDVKVGNKAAGFTCLKGVSRNYLRVFTRGWTPDGPPVESQQIEIVTPSWYGNSRTYRLMDYSHADGSVSYREVKSDSEGRLKLTTDGLGHDLSIAQELEYRAPVMLPLPDGGEPIVGTGTKAILPLRFYNCTGTDLNNVSFTVSSEYPTVHVNGETVTFDKIKPGETVYLGDRYSCEFFSTSGDMQHARIDVNIGYRGWYSQKERVDVRILPTPLEEAGKVVILDGGSESLPIFTQAGNQGGGSIKDQLIEEGSGDGDGNPERGERVAIWLKVDQGLDPFDKESMHKTWIHSNDPYVRVVEDQPMNKGREWTSVHFHASLIEIAPDCPPGHVADLILKAESWSFVWQPDTRYGEELLYQARQRHKAHIRSYKLKIGQ